MNQNIVTLKPTFQTMAKTLEKPVDGFVGITYTAWPHQLIKKNPVTKKNIGGRVWVAGRSKRSKTFLRAIHQPGDPGWPRGGFTVLEKGMDYPTEHFPDELRSLPPKKKKARSQLARKIRSGEVKNHAISDDYWNPPKMEEQEDIKEVEIYSTDMTAKEAADYIQSTEIGKLEDFVPEDEERVTVQRAWEQKNQEARDKVSTDMNAADAAKYIRDTPLKNLLGFVPDSETRKTVNKAWEKKTEK